MNTADQLRLWASGLLTLEAAVELLIASANGRLLAGPWVRQDASSTRFDPDTAAAECGHLSGGERRVLSIATSLASSAHPVDLSDAITGLDDINLDLVLRAFAHACGR